MKRERKSQREKFIRQAVAAGVLFAMPWSANVASAADVTKGDRVVVNSSTSAEERTISGDKVTLKKGLAADGAAATVSGKEVSFESDQAGDPSGDMYFVISADNGAKVAVTGDTVSIFNKKSSNTGAIEAGPGSEVKISGVISMDDEINAWDGGKISINALKGSSFGSAGSNQYTGLNAEADNNGNRGSIELNVADAVSINEAIADGGRISLNGGTITIMSPLEREPGESDLCGALQAINGGNFAVGSGTTVNAKQILVEGTGSTLTVNGNVNLSSEADFNIDYYNKAILVNNGGTATFNGKIVGGVDILADNGSTLTLNLADKSELGDMAAGEYTWLEAARGSTINIAAQNGILKYPNDGSIVFDGINASGTLNGKSAVINIKDGTLTIPEYEDKGKGTLYDGTFSATYGGEINITGGKVALKAGDISTKIAGDDTKGTITVDGGRLNLLAYRHSSSDDVPADADVSAFRFDSQKVADKSIVLKKGSILSWSGMFFSHSDRKIDGQLRPNAVITTVNGEDSPKEMHQLFASKVDLQGGKLVVTNTTYSYEYAQAAKALVDAASSGKTGLAFQGTMVDLNEKPKEELTLAQVKDQNLMLDNVAIKAPEASLAIDSSFGDEFHASSLDLKEAASGATNQISIDSDKKLILGGSKGGDDVQNITVGGKKPEKAVSIEVAGTIQFGATELLKDGAPPPKQTTMADIALKGNAVLNVEAGQQTVNKIESKADGTRVEVKNGATLTANQGIKLAKAVLKVVGEIRDTAVQAINSTILVGSEDSHDSKGRLSIDGLLTGSRIFADPAWKDGATIEDASQLAIAGTDVDYTLIVGQNSAAAIGTASLAAIGETFENSDQTWGSGENDIGAALYVAQPITLKEDSNGDIGGIYVGKDATESTTVNQNSVTFANNSLLMVDASKLGENAAITADGGTGTLTVKDGAKLLIDGADETTPVKIYKGFATVNKDSGENWAGKNPDYVFGTLGDTVEKINDDGTIMMKSGDIAKRFPNMVMPNVINNVRKSKNSGVGANILKIATASNGTPESDGIATRTVNAIAQYAETVGVTSTAISQLQDIGDAALTHYSYFSEDHDQDVWARYLHSRQHVSGRSLANFSASHKGSSNGIIAGGDLKKLGDYRHGVAIAYGEGSATSSSARNEFDTWGISYYGAVEGKSARGLFDITYAETDNEVKGLMGIKAEPKVKTISVGLRGEKRWDIGGVSLVPHIGLRYLNTSSSTYAGKVDGATAFNYAPGHASLCLLPVGIGLQGEQGSKAMKLHWLADVSYLGTLGGHKADMSVSVPGVEGAVDSFGYRVSDHGSFLGRVAVGAQWRNFSAQIGYSWQKGSSMRDNRLTASIGFKF